MYYVSKKDNSYHIIQALEKTFDSDLNTDPNCISLYEIDWLLKETASDYERIEKQYEARLYDFLKKKYGVFNLSCSFDYCQKRLDISLSWGAGESREKIKFYKKGRELYLKKHSLIGNDMLVKMGNVISELYDKFMQYSTFKTEDIDGISSVNSNFFVYVSCDYIAIKFNNFVLISYSFSNNYDYYGVSNKVVNYTTGNEAVLFSNIFVKIDECPEWSRDSLYKIRQEQLEEIRIAEEKELKRQKRLERVRKIFPFIKN